MDSYCVAGRHRSATTNIYDEIASEGCKVLIGRCSYCNLKNSLTASDRTIAAEVLGDFFRSLGEKRLNSSRKMAEKCFEKPRTSLGTWSKH